MANESYKSMLLDIIAEDAANYGISKEDITEVSAIGRLKNSLLTNADYQVAHAQLIDRESHVMTARTTSSMYKHASAANVPIRNSIPAKTDLFITVLLDDIKKHGTYAGGNEYVLFFSKYNPVTIGEFKYMLTNSVNIKYIDDTDYNDARGISNVDYKPEVDETIDDMQFITAQKDTIKHI